MPVPGRSEHRGAWGAETPSLCDGVFTVEFRGHVPAGRVATSHACTGTGMNIELDKPGPDGEPVSHWLIY
jgi:hypothetical protein